MRNLAPVLLTGLLAGVALQGCSLFTSQLKDGGHGLELHCSPAAPVSTGHTVERQGTPAVGVAAALDWLPVYDQMRELERDVADDEPAAFRALKLHQRLLTESVRASLDIAAVAAELECDLTSVDNVLDALNKQQGTLSKTETGISVIIAGITNILTGGFTLAMNTVADAIAAMAGGSVSGTFGALALMSQASHELHHERNLLREVWEGPEHSHFFPATVWRLLKQDRQDGQSLRKRLLDTWREQLAELNKKQGGDRTELFFGDGGTYGLDDLRTRLRMLESLSSVVQLLNQDLQVFIEDLAGR